MGSEVRFRLLMSFKCFRQMMAASFGWLASSIFSLIGFLGSHETVNPVEVLPC